jgi:peptidoglycan/xylan/chitin deacetylase (PgdA/CDA1 family)
VNLTAFFIRARTLRKSWHILPSLLVGNRLQIWMYHSICENPYDPHAIPPEIFLSQMQFLQDRKKQVITLEQALVRIMTKATLLGCVVLTFDDGYLDFYSNALPILERFQYPATLFIPTGKVGGYADWDSYDKTKKLMGWDELVNSLHRGMMISSHSVSHTFLTQCDPQQLQDELVSSLQTLQEHLGTVSPALAYPGGIYGRREQEAAREAGYLCALGTSSHWRNGYDTDLYQLTREKPHR